MPMGRAPALGCGRRGSETRATSAEPRLGIGWGLLLRMDFSLDPFLDPLAFLLKTSAEIAQAILEEDEKTEGEKKEEGQPEQAAK